MLVITNLLIAIAGVLWVSAFGALTVACCRDS
jgi:hypothetical protein